MIAKFPNASTPLDASQPRQVDYRGAGSVKREPRMQRPGIATQDLAPPPTRTPASRALAGVIRQCSQVVARGNFTLGGDLESLRGVRRIVGSLHLTSKSLTTLAPLAALEEVTGGVYLSGCSALESLEGLERLRSVKSFYLHYSGVKSLEGLAGLRKVSSLNLVGNALRDLGGLERFSSLYELRVECEQQLASLRGVENLRSVETLALDHLPALTSLAPLAELKVARRLTLGDCLGVESYAPLSSLQGIESLFLGPTSADLAALGHVTHLVGSLIAVGGIKTLAGLENLTQVGHVEIGIGLDSLAGLRGLRAAKSLSVVGTSLTSFAGLDALERIEGELLLLRNDRLEALDGLPRLRSAGSIRVEQHAALARITGFDRLEKVGSVELKDNPALADLGTLARLASA